MSENTKELTITEVSEILGISEKTLLKNWKQSEQKALQFGIVKEGRGKKATYIQTISENNNKIAYDILREFLINECGFNTRTDFNKLIHYLYLVLNDTINKKCYRNVRYMELIGVSEKNLISYRKKLTDSGVIMPKHLSKGLYMYMNSNNIYCKCDVGLYDSFKMCIIHRAKELFKEEYTLDLCDYDDYQNARDIIMSDFYVEDLEEIMNSEHSNDFKIEAIKDKTTNMNLKYKKEIMRFYKIAFFEVSKQWNEDYNIKHIKFVPAHEISYKILKDITFIEIIVNAYVYATEKQ